MASPWALSGHEALVLLGEPLASETERCERLLVSVTRASQFVHPEPARACGFLREAHPAFVDTSPLQLMLTKGRDGIRRVLKHVVTQARWRGPESWHDERAEATIAS